ncbi:MAG: 50S ribosomal protein L9 [Flavobacteriales bacterium TMED113]|nr:MAG: 50S ribosomal protein L9 [Flavobacteriales bacterium TMED113]
MEIILLKDVLNCGFKDDLVTVKNGYATNYLIPQGFAVLATESAKKILNENLKQRQHKEQELIKKADSEKTKLEKLDIKIKAKVIEDGVSLFGSVNNTMISDSLSQNGFEIDKKYIKIIGFRSIKKIGKYTANVRLHRDVNVDFDFEVIPA